MAKSKKQRKAAQKADINRILQVTKATDLAELRSRKAAAKAIFTKSRHQVLNLLEKEICNIKHLEEKQQELRNNFNNLLECLSAFSDLLKVECDTEKLEKTTLEVEKAEEEFRDVVDRIQERLEERNSVSYEQREVNRSHCSSKYFDVERRIRENKMSTKETDRVSDDEFQQNRSNNSSRNVDFKRRTQESRMRMSTEVRGTNRVSDEFEIIRNDTSSTNFDEDYTDEFNSVMSEEDQLKMAQKDLEELYFKRRKELKTNLENLKEKKYLMRDINVNNVNENNANNLLEERSQIGEELRRFTSEVSENRNQNNQIDEEKRRFGSEVSENRNNQQCDEERRQFGPKVSENRNNQQS